MSPIFVEDRMEDKNKLPTIKLESVRFKPQGIAQRCPVCNGFGSLNYGKKKCQACMGNGYILIPTEEVKNGHK